MVKFLLFEVYKSYQKHIVILFKYIDVMCMFYDNFKMNMKKKLNLKTQQTIVFVDFPFKNKNTLSIVPIMEVFRKTNSRIYVHRIRLKLTTY